MKERNLAPHILRQRLYIEGIYTIDINHPSIIENYLKQLTQEVWMTLTYGPIVQNEAELVNPDHKWYEWIIMWAESWTHAYTWEKWKFFTIDVYSCKEYDNKKIINFTSNFFKASQIQSKAHNSHNEK